MTSHDTIYQQALQSSDVKSVMSMASAFRQLGQEQSARELEKHAEFLTFQRAWPVSSDTLFGVDHLVYAKAQSPIQFRGTFAFGVDIGAVQARLNALGANPQLNVDGISGPMTIAAIEAFQSSHGLDADGVVGPLTLAAMGMTGEETAPTNIVPASGTGIAAVRGIEKTGMPFRNKLVQVSNALGISPDWLASAISFETGGTFSPAVQNPYSKATGLIQFIGPTAAKLGTTLDDLKAMTDIQQLDYVYQYFLPYKGRMRSLNDTYLAVFMPSQMGKSSDSVVASEGSTVYEQNQGFDQSGKGYFTVGDITSAVRSVYNAGISRGKVPVTVAIAGASILGAIALLVGGYFLWKGWKV